MDDSEQPKLSRRDLLRATGTVLPYTLLTTSLPASALAQGERKTLPTRTLGRTDAKISIVTVGAGQFQAGTNVKVDLVDQIVHRALELGVNSIDTAPNYSESEEYLGQVLKSHRDKVFLATKSEEKTYKGCWDLLRRSLKRLQTDHLDLVYIHNFGVESRFPDVKEALGPQGVLGALLEAKKQGVIRFIGASGHLYPSRFQAILERDDIDVIMNVANFVTRHIYNFEEKVFAPARKKNVGLIAMKVIGGPANWRRGTARLTGEYYEAAIRYGLGIPGVSSVNIGFRKVEYLEKAVQTASQFKPLTEKEHTDLEKLGKQLAQSWGPVYGKPVT